MDRRKKGQDRSQEQTAELRPAPSAIRIALILAFGALAFLPLTEHLGGSVPVPRWASALVRWSAATAVTLSLALLAARLELPRPWQEHLRSIEEVILKYPLAVAAASGAAALAFFAVLSVLVFDAVPLYIDELAQAQQAKIFLEGRLWAAVREPAEAFSSFQMVELGGRSFAQYTPGWPAALALGELIGLRWLMGPLAGGVAVAALLLLAIRLGERPLVALGAAALLACSPWFFLNAASHMNHTATTALIAVGALLLVSAIGSRNSTLRRFAFAGLAFGLAGAVRPADALAFAAPAGAWLLLRAFRSRRSLELVAFITGGIVTTLLVLAFNAATTGDPFTFGLVAQWGAGHELGFHEAPWGSTHTPQRGLAVINAYLRLMQISVFESPVPALLPVMAAMLLAGRVTAADRYLLVSSMLLLLVYFSYWGVSVEYIGPRFLLPIAPIVALWIARLPRVISTWSASPYMGRVATAWIALILLSGLPGMAAATEHYSGVYRARRFNPDELAQRQGIRNALILVPSSWPDELASRLWARGVGRPIARRLVRHTNQCLLERELMALEHENVSGAEAARRLARVRTRPDSTDSQAPSRAQLCRERRLEERRGTWSMLPFLLARRHGNVFARDVHERLEPLLETYAGRQVYVVRRHPVHRRAAPVFVPFNADSAKQAWARRRAVLD